MTIIIIRRRMRIIVIMKDRKIMLKSPTHFSINVCILCELTLGCIVKLIKPK